MLLSEVKEQVKNEINAIAPFDVLEQEHIDDTLRWIESGANIYRIAKPDKPSKHLVSYFVVIDPEHHSLLLGEHVKAQLWLPSGGHVELNEHPRATVRREVLEELGIEAVFLRNVETPFFITQTVTIGMTAGHTDVSLWYLLRGDIYRKLNFDRREFNDMNWFTFEEVLLSHPAIFDRHMHRFTNKLVKLLRSRT